MVDLWEELRGLGVTEGDMPTARALEDWQSEGLVETEWKSAGRGRGRMSRYRPGTAEKVVAIRSVLANGRSFDRVRMILFYRGFEVDFEKLRASYLRILAGVPDPGTLDPAGLDSGAAVEARKHSRAGQRGLVRQSGLDSDGAEPPEAIVASAIRNATRTLFGISELPLMEEDLAEIAVVHGIPLDVWSHLSTEVKESYEDKLNLNWIGAQIREMNQADLKEARDRLKSALNPIGLWDVLEETFAPILPIAHIFSADEPPPDM